MEHRIGLPNENKEPGNIQQKETKLRSVDDLSERDIMKIKNFVQHTDMRRYVRDFLHQRMGPKEVSKQPIVEIPQPVRIQPPTDGSHLFSIKILNCRAFLNFLDPDPNSLLVLDINIAGHRFRTKETYAEADPLITDSFTFKTYQQPEELMKYGLGSICAVVTSGTDSSIYGSGMFKWSEMLNRPRKLPVEIYDSNGDCCGIINIALECAPIFTDVYDEDITPLNKKADPPISPISSRHIPSPHHAFRFCSMFNCNSGRVSASAKIVASDNDEQKSCRPLHSVLAARSGTKLEICSLLASLLAGFGIDSYVCKYDGSVSVLTVQDNRATIWNPFTRKRQTVERLDPCVLFGAGFRLEPIVQAPNLELSDPRQWRRIAMHSQIPPPISACSAIDEQAVEMEVKRRILLLRGERQTRFNTEIETALRPQLFSNEWMRLNETVSVWRPICESAVRKLLPRGSTIKVENFNVHSGSALGIFLGLQSKAGEAIRADPSEEFVLALAIFPYAEDVCSTWVLFGSISKL